MERDITLIREILTDLRIHGFRTSDYGVTRPRLDYHLWLLFESDLVERGFELTDEGREWADLAGIEEVWQPTLERVRKRGTRRISLGQLLDLLRHFENRRAA